MGIFGNSGGHTGTVYKLRYDYTAKYHNSGLVKGVEVVIVPKDEYKIAKRATDRTGFEHVMVSTDLKGGDYPLFCVMRNFLDEV